MQTYTIAQTDLTVSRVAFGCAEIVTADDPDEPDTIARAARAIHTACDNGITLFDLAAMYAKGRAEAVFGQVLRQSPGLREKIVVQTKCGAVTNPARRATADSPFLFDCRRQNLVASVDNSLRKIGTDRIDLLLLHWSDLLAHPEEIAAAFEELHQSGKARYFGVSNHTAPQLALLKRYVRQPLVTNQIRLGLMHSYPIAVGLEPLRHWKVALPSGPTPFTDIIDFCTLHDVTLQAYSPLRGLVRSQIIDASGQSTPAIREAAQVLAELADSKGVTMAAIALAWLLHHPARIVTTIGGRNPSHIAENCAGDRVSLSREEWYRLLYVCASAQTSIAA